MKKIQEKIQKLEKQIVNEKVETGKKVLISEMKKIGCLGWPRDSREGW